MWTDGSTQMLENFIKYPVTIEAAVNQMLQIEIESFNHHCRMAKNVIVVRSSIFQPF